MRTEHENTNFFFDGTVFEDLELSGKETYPKGILVLMQEIQLSLYNSIL